MLEGNWIDVDSLAILINVFILLLERKVIYLTRKGYTTLQWISRSSRKRNFVLQVIFVELSHASGENK